MLEQLFKFPIAIIDSENEERKRRLGELPNVEEGDEYDIIYAEAEYPYWDLIGMEDRWLPTTKSFDNAMRGEFDACIVKFANVGSLLVPWSKTKFKSALIKFADKYELSRPPKEQRVIKVKTLTAEETKKILGDEEE